MVLTNIIRYLRYKYGEMTMTQQELAERVGVSRQTINALERSKHQPSLELAFKIADAFGKPIEKVFCYCPDLDIDYEWSITVIIEVSFDDPGS